MNSLTTYNGRTWSPLSELRREMDRLFVDFWPAPATARSLQDRDAQWSPLCDVEEDDDHYLISLEMAGVPKDQIQIEFHEGQLVISGERRIESGKKENGQQSYSERRYGRFQRAFTLPAGVDGEKVEASYQDGVLRVSVPKAESLKPRQIRITNGSDTGIH